MSSLFAEFKDICQEINLKPARSRGQNFLINKRIYDRIIRAANINKNDNILEIGPGLGYLTLKLAQKTRKVFAVEIDEKLAIYLKSFFLKKKINNVVILNKDIRKFSPNKELLVKNYKIVANLPYNVTSFFIKKFFSFAKKPQSMSLLLQKEVAQRIVAKPPQMSILAVAVQYYSAPQISFYVPRTDFWPQPKVDSAFIVLTTKKKLPLSPEEEKRFFAFVRAGFAAKRKMLKNNLADYCHLPSKETKKIIVSADFLPNIRAQDIDVKNWLKLFGAFKKKCYNIIK